jgi:3-oxoacyl-[acyl-carrier-protein] synthase III
VSATVSAVLSAPRYELGEIVLEHGALADLPARAGALGIAPAPALWGWGEVRGTARDLDELAVASGAATLAAAGGRCAVDAVILCSTRFPGGAEEHGGFVGRILAGLGLRDVAFHGLTLHRCANLLAAISLATVLVEAGVHRDVLVVTTDRIAAAETRVQKYALFSDGAASCVVSAQAHSGGAYEILATAAARDLGALHHDDEISADLARSANDSLLAGTGLELADIAAVMHANLVTPVVMMKERQAGFTAAQLDAANISRFGHCFAADPLINLVDRGRLGHVPPRGHVVLTTSVPGERHAVLLRHLPAIHAADQELAS